MAVTSTNSWLNNDGLYIKYGTDAAAVGRAGEFRTPADLRYIEIDLDLTKLPSTDGGYIVDDMVFFPENAFIEYVQVINHVAATGSGAVLNLGLIRKDRATEIDFNGFLAVAPVTDFDTAGETRTYTSTAGTYGGALIGTVSSSTLVGYICADYDTAAFTAGKIVVRIFYSYQLTS